MREQNEPIVELSGNEMQFSRSGAACRSEKFNAKSWFSGLVAIRNIFPLF
jgi:hypothetical protein